MACERTTKRATVPAAPVAGQRETTMSTTRTVTFPSYTQTDAPAEARPHLDAIAKKYGGVPNLFAKFAGSPALLEAYGAVGEIYARASGFDATERQVVLITASVENGCTYCVAAHSTISGMEDVPNEVVEALRDATPLPTARLEALRTFTLAVVRERGWVADASVQAFLDAGFEQRHVLDVVLGVGFKTLSNYANHLTSPELDAGFQAQAWSDPRGARAGVADSSGIA